MDTAGANAEEVNAPNWLRELEAKRERRLKARLGHEAGAGSPCLKCQSGCPGLDLHFWRKICKSCKCGKENHDVHDDDLHGWAQFQLLGSKPRTPQRFVLPGKKDEVVLDWAPKGSKEAVESYLRDIPTEMLPIKGSKAAKDRKLLLQKQMPMHDLDPTLCDALTEDETKKMGDYVKHLQDHSVGVGKLVAVDAKLITNKMSGQMSCVEVAHLKPMNISHGLEKMSIKPRKHDYENIDAFGKPKLEAELEKLQQINDCLSNPAQALYGMLLDKSSVPLKDHHGNPIKTTLDYYGNPIIDSTILELIGPLAKAEYALLLDKNCAPILDSQGLPIKNVIAQATEPVILDKFGNRVRPQMALLLDGSKAPMKDQANSPIKVPLDAYSQPIIPRNFNQVPKFAKILDKNGASIIDHKGDPMIYDLLKPSGFKFERPSKFAKLLDKNRHPIMHGGNLLVTNLDPFGTPILSDSIIEKLGNVRPQFASMLDAHGKEINVEKPLDVKDPIYDKFGKEIRVKYGLLLKDDAPIRDALGKPVGVQLDAFRRPIIDSAVLEKIGFKKPEYSMPLHANGAPILDNSGKVIKDPILVDDNAGTLQKGLLLDGNLQVIKDPYGKRIKVDYDENGKAILDLNQVINKKPEFVLGLNENLGPIYDDFGNPKIDKLEVNRDKFGNEIEPIFGVLLDAQKEPILDASNSPIMVDLDGLKRPIYDHNLKPKYVKLLDRNGAPIYNAIKPIRTQPKYAQIDGVNVNLDAALKPIIDENTLNKLGKKLPKEAIYLDEAGNIVYDDYGRPRTVAIDTANQNSGAASALLLDQNFAPILDQNEPIKLKLDAVKRPIIDNSICERVGFKEPQFIMFLDENNEPLLDNYGQIVHEKIPEESDVKAEVEVETKSNCHRCKKVLNDNAIEIDRCSSMWHVECFKCAGCNQSLADFVYCYDDESDDVYCLRDYAKIRGIPRCNACDELILCKEYCLAQHETYHVKHFCCFECDSQLAGNNYLVENKQPVCLECYDKLMADKCAKCLRVIGAEEQGVNIKGSHFHATDDCFRCQTCSKPLLNSKMLFKDMKLYCSSPCYHNDK
ncbi:PREDICTED: uncharacterized protein LOC108560419 [Nicrophorus vespilloides]|uniref:Uncharacterized protein LOC108560419 n=1 Tax=Nicrophorus vespilloides TaxID=110193 RepID=A0ABM1MFT9_NICVS|nr:PREDICTED: uncharacterized protein LOC108560419 [Nicrophorus vespilloides]